MNPDTPQVAIMLAAASFGTTIKPCLVVPQPTATTFIVSRDLVVKAHRGGDVRGHAADGVVAIGVSPSTHHFGGAATIR